MVGSFSNSKIKKNNARGGSDSRGNTSVSFSASAGVANEQWIQTLSLLLCPAD